MIYIVPSRGRPHKIEELIKSWDETRINAHLFVAVDEDDPAVGAYRKILKDAPDWVSWRLAPRMRMIGTLNHWALKFIHHNDVIGFMGDDHRPRTIGWDEKIEITALDPAVVYGNDLLQGANLPTAVALPSDWIDVLGWMAPPCLTHLWADNFWRELGTELGRLTYLPDVVIEHMHPIAGKSEWDDVYVEVNSGEMYTNDASAYLKFKQTGEFDAAVARVRSL